MGKKNIGERHDGEDLKSNENLYRVGHPLAQMVIEQCKQQEAPLRELIFDYTGLVHHQRMPQEV